MKKIIFLLFVLCTCLFSQEVFSQLKMDSLLQVLKTGKEDTIKASTLNLLGEACWMKGNYEQSRKYSKEALQLSEKINFEIGKAGAYLVIGTTYFLQNNYSEALKNFYPALAICEKNNLKKGIANCYNNIALVYTYQGNYHKALELHFASLKIFQKDGNSKGLINAYNNIGIIYDELGNHPEALKSYFASLKIAEKEEDKKAIADAYLNIGFIYNKQNNLQDEMKNYSAALKLYEEIDYKQGIGECYSALVKCYSNQKDYKKALEVNLKAIEILESIGDKASATHAKDNRAYLYIEQNNYVDALKIFFDDLKVFQEMKDSINIASSYNNIGIAYYKLNKYDEAISYFNKGLSLAKEVDAKDKMVYCYKSLSEVYEKKNDYKNAYLYHKLFFDLNDSLFNETKSKQVAAMKTQYETEKKDNEIDLLNKDKEIQNIEIKKQKLLMCFFIGGLGSVIVLLLFGYRNYKTRQTLRLQDIRNKIAGDLHDDIGSTLNSISIYSEVARKKDEQQDEALEMIGEASRKIIDAMSDIVWTVTPENDSFSKIIFRMKSFAYNLFRAKKIEFTFHSDESLNEKKLSLESRRNLYLIFKEAINNLVKYSSATTVAITLINENEFIKLCIKDNGVGFDTSQDNVGNGLKNMKRRADEIKASFKIESSKENGTQIELILKV